MALNTSKCNHLSPLPFKGLSWSNAVCLCACVSMCLDVNQSGTNRNRCTQRLVILRAQTH